MQGVVGISRLEGGEMKWLWCDTTVIVLGEIKMGVGGRLIRGGC